MKRLKEQFDMAAKELLLIQDMRQALYRWNINLSSNDQFLGQYLSNLHDLAKELMFRSLNMSHNFVTFEQSETGPRTILAMIGNDTALSMGNVEWCLTYYRDYETLWKALYEHDEEAIASIDSKMMFPAGNITNFPKDKIVSLQSRALTDKEIFDKVVETVILNHRIDRELLGSGLSLNFEHGTFGKHCIAVEHFLTECLLMVLHLHGERHVDETTWSFPVHFTVFYPDNTDSPVDISTLDEDFAKLRDDFDNPEVPEKMWNAYTNFDVEAIQWLKDNTKAKIGPVEE